MDVSTLRRTGEDCTGFLLAHADTDWTTCAPDMTWNSAEVVAHLANTLFWYAHDFAAGAVELPTTEITVRSAAVPTAQLVRSVSAGVSLLAAVLTQGGPEARGWHPRGVADDSGFAAMACDELLVHTADVARAIGAPFTPARELAEETLRRLFPWAHSGEDPWRTLLWANGRTELPDHPRLVKWTWHCAPLSEWDGSSPV
ncbi:maleylpyruvate isomerase N-terminal domain-containing protein [Prauserella flavalba]|uniref:Mycothiol-dependent maleylpyruvate isomerase metal-binding domain-containing protein n=1 Tax=Prauserella flavalba TaxID=1477506 RepID=A0A318LGP0_9PSEU|nr:maleylpyruvate isomerase N-terminal domain-containing protein [Prauserella flavalba]PXY24228.1 hypothetical protein BA062_28790 [Prauserella flavalba]